MEREYSRLFLDRIKGLKVDWSVEEKAIMEQGLSLYATEPSEKANKYLQIAYMLPYKNARQVAMRHKWITMKKQQGKKKIEQNENLPNGHTSPSSRKSGAIEVGELEAKLLEQNEQALSQILTNLEANILDKNVYLFRKTGENIETIMDKARFPSPFDARMDLFPRLAESQPG